MATNDFSEENVLGQGGFGKVYKGVLGDHTEIAVKRMIDNESPSGVVAFLREVEIISVADHKNLLRLIGFCTTPSERLLVYPFMKNRSVASCLRGTTCSLGSLSCVVSRINKIFHESFQHIVQETFANPRSRIFSCSVSGC